MGAVIVAEGLTKTYGASRGVEAVSFEVGGGEVFGFLGPNGAGKTTTIRLLLDFIRPSSGTVSVFGEDAHRNAVAIHRRTGYLPGDLRLYDRMTGREVIDYFSALRRSRAPVDLDMLVERLEVDLARPVRTLSRGNRQKIGLVQALMDRPELIVLDEPTSGLDPLIQQEVSAILREAVADGRTVFLSSHILPEVQRVADRVAVIRDGRIALIERVETLRARAATHIEVTFANAPDPSVFGGVAGTEFIGARGPVVSLRLEGSIDPLVKLLANYEVRALDIHEADLEDMFRQLYTEGRDDVSGS
jgi:ABC-2 type transport system ATP-binding protein